MYFPQPARLNCVLSHRHPVKDLDGALIVWFCSVLQVNNPPPPKKKAIPVKLLVELN